MWVVVDGYFGFFDVGDVFDFGVVCCGGCDGGYFGGC